MHQKTRSWLRSGNALYERKYPIRAVGNPESARQNWNMSNHGAADLMAVLCRLDALIDATQARA
jgi:hypothetical protein